MNLAGGENAALAVRVTKSYASAAGGFRLEVAASFPPGVSVLFGASGAGKTTLLDAIAGLTEPESGRIALGDETWFDAAAGVNVPVAQRRLAYLFQDLALFPHLTAAQNIGYGLRGRESAERERRVREMALAFGIGDQLGRKPAQLSGGERQRVALARALVVEPRAVLLDEPLSGLDAATKALLVADLRRWNEQRRVPIVYVTHSREEVFALAERVLVLENGKVAGTGTPQEALEAPARESVAQLAGYENIFDGQVMELHPRSGTMTCRIAASGPTLELPLGRAEAGARVRVGVRAGDILLATAEPQKISARNILRGQIAELREADYMVVAQVDCGARFEVHLTPAARTALALAPGSEVWLIVKTHSLRVLHRPTDDAGVS